MQPFNPSAIQAGDALLYRPASLMGWVIAVKTWRKVSHVEIYCGDGSSVASRDGLGVNRYSLRTKNLAFVRRPTRPWDFRYWDAMKWFSTVRGQKYDWKGLLCFTLAVKEGSQDRMFCSEFATRFYREASYNIFDPGVDADTVAPSCFLETPALETVWDDGKE